MNISELDLAAMIRKNPDLAKRNKQRIEAAKQPGSVRGKPQKPGKLRGEANQTESIFYDTFLAYRSDLAWTGYEQITLLLENGTRYTPDWVAVTITGHIFVFEIKGAFIRRDSSRDKFLLGRKQYTGWTFEAWQLQENKEWREIWKEKQE